MGLNVKEIHLHLFKMVKASTKSSYTFIQKHPLISGALLVCFFLYIFLSYIYSFLVYMSPFLVCAFIFVRIFWSSEKTQLKYVKSEEEKGRVVPKYPPKIPNNGRREIMLSKYPSQNATSRRRNFREKKWDVYGGLEEKAKDLSAVFYNEFTNRNIESKEAKFLEKGESSLDAKKFKTPRRRVLRSKPSMVESDGREMEDLDDEDEEEAQEDRNKAIEWTEDDQKNLMNLGVSEMERNKRLECLMARRRAKKLLKLQVENGLIDKKSIAPVITSRGKNFDSSEDFEGADGLEMPGSAPSLRPQNPFDIPYDPPEERPNLTGDSFHQEFSFSILQKDIPFCRHESSSLGHTFPSETRQEARDKLAFSSFRRISDTGNHDWLIDQLMYGEGGERGFQSPNPLREREDENFNTNIDDLKDENLEKAQETKSMLDQTSHPSLVPNISNVEQTSILDKPNFPKPKERLFSFPMSNTTNINESMHDIVPSPIDKRQETMFLPDRRICHTPTCSIASDLQVEVSEVGSPASTSSSTDKDSVLYDGDIDRDVSSGSEDFWGASFHGREVHRGGNEEDVAEENNSKDLVSPVALQQIDEEKVADVSSLSSNPDIPDDTPTNATNGRSDHNIFGYKKFSVGETEVPESSDSSHVPLPHKELINNSVDQSPNETDSGKPEELRNLSENFMNEAQVINDENISTTIEHDNIENSRSNNEDHGTSVWRRESIDEASIYSVSSSPRSVLPEKTMADEVSSLAFDENMNIDAEQSIMEGEPLNSEPAPPNTVPQNIQPLVDETTSESHNVDFSQSQVQTDHVENSIGESNTIGNMNDEEVHNKENQEELKNDEKNKENSTLIARQKIAIQSASQINEMTMEDILDKKSRDLVDDKLPLKEKVEDDKNEKPTSNNVHENLPQQRFYDQTIPSKEANEEVAEDS